MAGPGDRVLVAVSGGSDSVGLLAIFHRLRRKLGVELVAAHVNHRLRGAESDADEACAAAAAAALAVPFVRGDLPAGLRRGGNREERARELRYAALADLARDSACSRIATGHTRGDQAETLLFRLVRGSGPAGLAGIRRKRDDGVIRPLLDCTRDEVRAFAQAAGLAFREDASNDDLRFGRNRIRHEIMPRLRRLNPAAEAALARVADLLRAEQVVVDEWVRGRVGRATRDGALSLARLAEVPEALRGHVIRRWLFDAGIPEPRLGGRQVDLVGRLAAGTRPGGSVALPGGFVVQRNYDLLSVERAGGTRPDPDRPVLLRPGGEIALAGGWRLRASEVENLREYRKPSDLWHAVCDADGASQGLLVRHPLRGERVRPVGMSGSRKLSDVFVDGKVPRSERSLHPVVASGGEIVWLPGLVRGRALCVQEQTRRIVRLSAARSGGSPA